MQRLRNTLDLAKASWEVLKADKELLLLPIMSAVATLIVAATFVIPLLATGSDTLEDPGPVLLLTLFLLYMFLAFITIFFNAALVHAADERLRGGDPTLRSALRGAASSIHRILPWALVSATVSVILRALEERAGFIGRIVISLIGIAWSLVTFLVIPVLVLENVGVFDAIRRSGELFKRTWGENVAAQVGFGLLGFVAALPAILLVFTGAAAGSVALGIAIVLAVLWIGFVAIVLASLNGIFQTALYHFAVDGSVPGGFFPESALAGIFTPKQRRSSGW